MRVIIREEAYDDLDRIYAWIAKDRPRSADAVTAAILKSTGLGRFPYIGHDGSAPGTYEWVIPELRYIVVYRIRESEDLSYATTLSSIKQIAAPATVACSSAARLIAVV
jgi:plasmid stabilization system protein ParE